MRQSIHSIKTDGRCNDIETGDRYCDNYQYEARIPLGRQLAALLQPYRGGPALMLALPPGGIPIAAEAAQTLRLPLDVIAARAFYVPSYPTVIAGAISEGGGLCLNRAAFRLPDVAAEIIWYAAQRARHDVAMQVAVYRRGRALPRCNRRPVILVDDDLGSGLVQLAIIQALRRFHPQHYVVATPRGTTAAIERVARYAEVVALEKLAQDEPGTIDYWRCSLTDSNVAALLRPHQMPPSEVV